MAPDVAQASAWQARLGQGTARLNRASLLMNAAHCSRNPGHRRTEARLCMRQVTQGDGSGVGDGGSGGWCDSGQRQWLCKALVKAV